MNCQEFADEILLHAADALEPEESEPLLDHLASGCPRCAGRLAEAKSLLGLLVLSLPPATPSAESRKQLLARLATAPNRRMMTHHVAEPVPPAPIKMPQPAIPWWMQLAVPSSIAAAIAAIVTIAFAIRMERGLTARDTQSTTDFQRTVATLTNLVQQQQTQIASLNSSSAPWVGDAHVQTFTLAGTDNQPADARARIYWDHDRSQWYFYAQGMRPAPAGKTYELWFVADGGKTAIPAGSFTPGADGQATLVSSVPDQIASSLIVGAVTDEPAGANITAPTGSFQLKGTVAQ